ncbi:MAG: cation diffusion facilitator family transporter [Marinobacter sp.]|uniref:cation diffusion facilitator family transporter n=1 Tax=Marinobacter sp. TaxID=50741 RepID=UPI0034A0484B
MSATQTKSSHSGGNQKSELRIAAKVTVIGMMLDAVLGVIKCAGGLLFHSQALVVDGIHSFTDVASDLVVLAVMKVSRQAPDQSHPYGHQRIETMGTMLLGSLLIAVGGALAWDNLQRLMAPSPDRLPEWPVLVAAIASVIGKEWIFRYTRRVGEAIRSDLILANAWHSRTDAFSSIIVLLSTIGAMMGHIWLDAVAAVAIAFIICRIGWRFTWDSVKELVDTAMSHEDTEKLIHIAKQTEGIRGVHKLRSRLMGHDILLDVHLLVKPEISVSEGHQVGMQVVAAMREAFPDLKDINFHIDAENDELVQHTTARLPSRQEIGDLISVVSDEFPIKTHLRLHYLGNQVHLELFVEHSAGKLPDSLEQQLRDQLEPRDWFGSLRIWYSGEAL